MEEKRAEAEKMVSKIRESESGEERNFPLSEDDGH